MDAMKKSTFGAAPRNNNLAKENPGPGKYYPIQFTEASHRYTFPRAGIDGHDSNLKNAHAPGPQTYFGAAQDPRNMSVAMQNAKSMLGGSLE